MSRRRFVPPAIGILLVAIGLLTMGAQSIMSARITFSEYGGVIIDSREEVRLSNSRLVIAGSDIAASGTVSDGAVLMSTNNPSPLASPAIPEGNWYYGVDVSARTGITPAATTFKVELHRWNIARADYDPVGTLYVRSGSSPVAAEMARCYFDLGLNQPGPNEAFMVLLTRVQ